MLTFPNRCAVQLNVNCVMKNCPNTSEIELLSKLDATKESKKEKAKHGPSKQMRRFTFEIRTKEESKTAREAIPNCSRKSVSAVSWHASTHA